MDTRLDIIGVALILFAVITLLSFLSPEPGALTRVWLRTLYQGFGWGAWVIPVPIAGIGVWLIWRHFGDQLPEVDPIRIAGIAVVFVGMLTLMHTTIAATNPIGPVWINPALADESNPEYTPTKMWEEAEACPPRPQQLIDQGYVQQQAYWSSSDIARCGHGGGYVGAMIQLTLQNLIGGAAVFIIALAAVFGGGLMAARKSLKDVLEYGSEAYQWMQDRRTATAAPDDAEEEDEDDEKEKVKDKTSPDKKTEPDKQETKKVSAPVSGRAGTPSPSAAEAKADSSEDGKDEEDEKEKATKPVAAAAATAAATAASSGTTAAAQKDDDTDKSEDEKEDKKPAPALPGRPSLVTGRGPSGESSTPGAASSTAGGSSTATSTRPTSRPGSPSRSPIGTSKPAPKPGDKDDGDDEKPSPADTQAESKPSGLPAPPGSGSRPGLPGSGRPSGASGLPGRSSGGPGAPGGPRPALPASRPAPSSQPDDDDDKPTPPGSGSSSRSDSPPGSGSSDLKRSLPGGGKPPGAESSASAVSKPAARPGSPPRPGLPAPQKDDDKEGDSTSNKDAAEARDARPSSPGASRPGSGSTPRPGLPTGKPPERPEGGRSESSQGSGPSSSSESVSGISASTRRPAPPGAKGRTFGPAPPASIGGKPRPAPKPASTDKEEEAEDDKSEGKDDIVFDDMQSEMSLLRDAVDVDKDAEETSTDQMIKELVEDEKDDDADEDSGASPKPSASSAESTDDEAAEADSSAEAEPALEASTAPSKPAEAKRDTPPEPAADAEDEEPEDADETDEDDTESEQVATSSKPEAETAEDDEPSAAEAEEEEQEEEEEKKPAKPPKAEDKAAPKSKKREWIMPDPDELLNPSKMKKVSDEELRSRAEIIEQTLSSFGAPGRVVEVNHGPVITQYGVEPDYIDGRGGKRVKVKVGKISSLSDDLALALAAPTIRIEAPVPGKGFVGIEVPNAEPSVVGLRDVMNTPEFNNVKSPLRLALGQDVSGAPIVADLTAMPHLLIAGTTGSGKSVCVNGIISTMLMNMTPSELKLIMVDPKRVELTNYNGIPHLMAPVVTELERIVGVLKWVQREMDDRYRKFAMAGARNITDYNSRVEKGRVEDDRLPYILVIVDELADLMMLAPDETERVITRLAQMARATGIHIIISTQRPSVDVVTGLIKANFPARIAFAVATGVDSRVILDMPGAEKLLGRGDMLFQAPDAPLPVRMQGVFVSDSEIDRIVNHWRNEADKMPDKIKTGSEKAPFGSSAKQAKAMFSSSVDNDDDDEVDDLYDEAVELVRDMEKASISLLQRHLRIGYTRAARLIEVMEDRGIVGEHEGGSQPREVLEDEEEDEN